MWSGCVGGGQREEEEGKGQIYGLPRVLPHPRPLYLGYVYSLPSAVLVVVMTVAAVLVVVVSVAAVVVVVVDLVDAVIVVGLGADADLLFHRLGDVLQNLLGDFDALRKGE